jgi:cytochrome c oxidase subunit 2
MFSGASNIANEVGNIFLFILLICATLLLLITFLMVYFVIKYNRKKNVSPADIKGNNTLEVIWTVVPTILVMAMFYYGWTGYKVMKNAPKDAMLVKVTGVRWKWTFEYENGKIADKLYAPLGRPVKLELSAPSNDVIHSFYVPAFKIKEDVVPGMKTYLWFKPTELGEYDALCAEYCGVDHSKMLSKVIVMPEEEFRKWYSQEGTPGEKVESE